MRLNIAQTTCHDVDRQELDYQLGRIEEDSLVLLHSILMHSAIRIYPAAIVASDVECQNVRR
jgi:hypothetical protein